MDEITSELQAIDFTHDANDPHLGQPNISKSQLYAHHLLNSTSFRLLTILPGEGHEGIVEIVVHTDKLQGPIIRLG